MWHLSAPFHSELLCEGYEVPVWSLYVLHLAATGGPRHAGPGAKMATSAWHHLFGEWSANVLVFKFVKFKVLEKKNSISQETISTMMWSRGTAYTAYSHFYPAWVIDSP